MPAPARIAVFASGGGSNLQALLDRFDARLDAAAHVVLVVGSRPDIGALRRAEAAGVPGVALSPRICGEAGFADSLSAALRLHRVDLVVLAGYLQLVPPEVVHDFRGRMVNVHPALLPAFGGQGMYGSRVHRAVLDSGARVSGATVHLVDEHYDRGRILAQWPVPVRADDTPEMLAARVLRLEHLLLPAVVEALVTGGPSSAVPDAVAFDLRPADVPDAAGLFRSFATPSRIPAGESR